MVFRALWIALVFLAFSLAGWCRCSKKPEAPSLVQLEGKVGSARSHVVTRELPSLEEGAKYRLSHVEFSGNKAIKSVPFLRNLVPLNDGDVFDVAKVRKGIENLNYAYNEFGYLDFAAVPETQIDDQNRLITLTMCLNEGVQYYISSVAIVVADRQREAALLAMWPESQRPGTIYNVRLVEMFFVQAKSLLPPDVTPERNLIKKKNLSDHTVDLTLRLGPD